jgi:hypothetical protein
MLLSFTVGPPSANSRPSGLKEIPEANFPSSVRMRCPLPAFQSEIRSLLTSGHHASPGSSVGGPLAFMPAFPSATARL